MNLRTLIGFKRHEPQRPSEQTDLSVQVCFQKAAVDPFDAGEPLRDLYCSAILAAQDGRWDNPLKQLRYFVLAQLAQKAAAEFPDLDLAECGCFHGHSTHMLAEIMKAAATGSLHVFDSFEGLSEFRPEDAGGTIAQDQQETIRAHFKSNYGEVTGRFAKYDFVRFYRGWIPERFLEVADRSFSFVSIDVDLYEPTRDCVAFFYPRLIEGGIMYFDDYGSNNFPGARRAIDEVLSRSPPRHFMRMPFGSSYLIK